MGIVSACALTGLGVGLMTHSNSDFVKYRVKEDHVVSDAHLARKRAMKEMQEIDRLEREKERIFDDRFFGESTSNKS